MTIQHRQSIKQKISKNKNNPGVETLHTLLIGDTLNVLSDSYLFEDNFVNLMVTSPPYGLNKNYGVTYNDSFDLSRWTAMIEDIGKQAYRILKPDGSFFINISPIPNPKSSEIIPLDSFVYFALKKCGFYLRNKIVWHFHNMQNCVKRLSGRWEAILWFVKDIDNYIFNLNAIKVPYITKKDKRLTGDGRNPTDVWYFNRINNMTKKKLEINHPCVYPEKMIERIIKMSSNPGDVILDPFVGSGTTMRVAKILNRNSIGIEINQDYEDIIRKRVEPQKATLYGTSNFEVQKYL